MVEAHFAVQVRDLATGAFVGQVEVHIDLLFVLQLHSALGDCSESRFRRYRQQHIEPQCRHQLVRQVQGLEFREVVVSL